MTKRMLIDATHAEETRVVVMDGNRLVEFDYESMVRKQLKGSIFLAKVTRVEPSLQAAFVNFGGNRHGFLPFAEIHPDYFRIPIADREALIEAQRLALEAQAAAEDAEDEEDAQHRGQPHSRDAGPDDSDGDREGNNSDDAGMQADAPYGADERDDSDADEEDTADTDDRDTADADEADDTDDGDDARALADNDADNDDEDGEADSDIEAAGDDAVDSEGEEQSEGGRGRRGGRGRGRDQQGPGGRGGNRWRGRGRRPFRSRRDERVEEDPSDPQVMWRNMRRQYKIQEVLKRGQIMLVQVSKEERGNKGAAVTTYLSLPGRYCVLMPNSPRAGGVSRKIANFEDRRRMKDMLRDLQIPTGMSVIVRTAGVARGEEEVRRDLDYLMRLWGNVRDLTLKSTAPAAVYEEGDLIKRAIRDIYSRDIDEIHVSGKKGFDEAQEFMGMLMPGHEKKIKQYKEERIPLFHRYQVESQIADIGDAVVTLKSGGYLVIHPTEALVSVDVNSGRATKERHIEETALKTNLEAAEEVARQLRLRDLGGLVVVDFIDMEDRRNNSRVEQRLRQALSNDRARVQMGRISSFGLLELSRQRLNPSLTEAQFKKCDECGGQGHTRTDDSAAIMALRALEDEGIKGRASQLLLRVSPNIAVYILNHKRGMLVNIEERYGFKVIVQVDDQLRGGKYEIDIAQAAVRDMRGDDEDGDDEPGDARPPAPDRSRSRDDSDGDEEERASGTGAEDGDDRSEQPEGHAIDRERGRRSRGGRNRNRGGRGRRDFGGDANDNSHDQPREPAAEFAPFVPDGDSADEEPAPRAGHGRGRGGRGRGDGEGRGGRNGGGDRGERYAARPDRAESRDQESRETVSERSAQPAPETVAASAPRLKMFTHRRAPQAENASPSAVTSPESPANDTPSSSDDGSDDGSDGAPQKKGWWGKK